MAAFKDGSFMPLGAVSYAGASLLLCRQNLNAKSERVTFRVL